MNNWITVDEVKQFTGVKPTQFDFSKEDTEKLDEMIQEWISQSMALIKSYCHNKFSSGINEAVKNVCLRLTSNMIALAIARRDTPITKINDWTITITNSEIFSKDLKEDLTPYIIDKSTVSDSISIITITGD